MPTVKELREHLSHKNDNEVIHYIIWSAEDVIGQAESQGLEVTQEQAESVLESLENSHDCNHGTTRETIDFWVGEL